MEINKILIEISQKNLSILKTFNKNQLLLINYGILHRPKDKLLYDQTSKTSITWLLCKFHRISYIEAEEDTSWQIHERIKEDNTLEIVTNSSSECLIRARSPYESAVVPPRDAVETHKKKMIRYGSRALNYTNKD